MKQHTRHTQEYTGDAHVISEIVGTPARPIWMAVLLVVGLFASGCSENPVADQADLDDDFVYERSIPTVTKAILIPGTQDLETMLTRDVDGARALSANTIYVYADYSYYDGDFRYTHVGRFGETAEQQT
ncbi:MAG: hypothetical protein WD423_10600 [Rhodothermales bacterium]